MWSADLAPRERLLPPWLIGTLGGFVALALAMMFPRERLETRLLEGGKVDALSMAYLEAWLRVRPNDGEFLAVLAAQYVRTGRLDEAEAMLARMRTLHDKAIGREALLLDIAIREQRAYALQPGDARRKAYLDELRGLLGQALDYRWTASEMEVLAGQARGLDAGAIAARFYQRLSKQDPSRAAQWQSRSAEIALGVGTIAPPRRRISRHRRRLRRSRSGAGISWAASRRCRPAACWTKPCARRSSAPAR